jgi:hypothetical protein
MPRPVPLDNPLYDCDERTALTSFLGRPGPRPYIKVVKTHKTTNKIKNTHCSKQRNTKVKSNGIRTMKVNKTDRNTTASFQHLCLYSSPTRKMNGNIQYTPKWNKHFLQMSHLFSYISESSFIADTSPLLPNR